jgi:hypothetical protein
MAEYLSSSERSAYVKVAVPLDLWRALQARYPSSRALALRELRLRWNVTLDGLRADLLMGAVTSTHGSADGPTASPIR